MGSSAGLSLRGRALGAIPQFPLTELKKTETFGLSSLHQPGTCQGQVTQSLKQTLPCSQLWAQGQWWSGALAWRAAALAAHCCTWAQESPHSELAGLAISKRKSNGFLAFTLIKYKLLESCRSLADCSYMHLSYNCILNLCFCCSKPALNTGFRICTEGAVLAHVEELLPGEGRWGLPQSSCGNPYAGPFQCLHPSWHKAGEQPQLWQDSAETLSHPCWGLGHLDWSEWAELCPGYPRDRDRHGLHQGPTALEMWIPGCVLLTR